MPYPYYQQYTPGQFQPAPHQEVTRVNGRGGAETYPMGPNSSALLLDTSGPIVWLKATDGAGYPTLSPYTITPYEPEKPVDLHTLEERIAKLEEKIDAKQPDSSRPQWDKHGKDPANDRHV